MKTGNKDKIHLTFIKKDSRELEIHDCYEENGTKYPYRDYFAYSIDGKALCFNPSFDDSRYNNLRCDWMLIEKSDNKLVFGLNTHSQFLYDILLP